MIAKPQKWLERIPWECVVEQNQKLCETSQKLSEASQLRHELVPERHERVRKLWDTLGARTLDLEEALAGLQQCVDLGPFRYNNVSTFSAVARMLVEEPARHLQPVEARILLTTLCQYVERKVSKAELRQVIAHLDKQLKAAPSEVAVPPAAAPVPAHPLPT